MYAVFFLNGIWKNFWSRGIAQLLANRVFPGENKPFPGMIDTILPLQSLRTVPPISGLGNPVTENT